MSGPDYPDAPPPEVPEEFAAAYREAYRRALEDSPEAETPFVDPLAELVDVPPQEVVRVGTHRSEDDAAVREATGWRATRWFLPVVISASALVLVLAAYAVGTVFSGDDDPGATRTATPSAGRPTPTGGAESPDAGPTSKQSSAVGGWEGAVTAVSIDAIAADCTAGPSRDSAGREVTYVPEKAVDDKVETAWRCSGKAVGEILTLRIAEDVDIAEVGLIPGYAKTDPESGADRYAENNRITKVRWNIGDDISVVQRLDPDPDSRAVQLLRVPVTTTDTITLEILAVKRGSRNTTAISEIVVAAVAGD